MSPDEAAVLAPSKEMLEAYTNEGPFDGVGGDTCPAGGCEHAHDVGDGAEDGPELAQPTRRIQVTWETEGEAAGEALEDEGDGDDCAGTCGQEATGE